MDLYWIDGRGIESWFGANDYCCAFSRYRLVVTFRYLMAQIRDAGFVLNGSGIVLGSVATCCLDSFPIGVIAHYSLELTNWSGFGAYIRWRQRWSIKTLWSQSGFPAERLSLWWLRHLIIWTGMVALQSGWVGLRGLLLTWLAGYF